MGHQKMRWDQLLCEERQGHEQHPDETRRKRSQFERDFDTGFIQKKVNGIWRR